MKKNCDNCTHLEWAFGDVGDSEGFACNKRDYYKKGDFYINEQRHQERLEDDKYRSRPKKCHEPKEANE